ncbi:MAG: rod shape-determining protein RodA [Acidimicrobiales bacterium]
MAQLVIDRRRAQSAWRQLLLHVDLVLLAATLTVSAVGVLMVYTATRSTYAQYYLDRQGIWTLIGVGAMVLVASVDYHRFEDVGYVLYGAVLLGLVGVFVVGHNALGSTRWFQIGPLQLQPSAFAAIALILAVATYCSRRQEEGLNAGRVAALLVMLAVPTVLVIKQPDLGSAIVMVIAFGAILVVAGVKLRYLAAVAVLGGLAVFLVLDLGILHHYQSGRLSSFLHQSAGTNKAAYQINQSKITIGSGGFFGKGIGHGSQTNLGYVPEQYTDFIFTAVGEQLGFVGTASLLALFAVILWRILRTAQLAKDHFGRLVCAGVLGLIGFSVFQNAGMTMGIMPITGIPLPFVSYGGSSTIAFFAAIGLTLNVGMRRYT